MHEFRIPSAYTLIKREGIPDVQSEGYLLRHNRSGARVMLLANEDDNKVFCIGFRTTPKDSTGVAHIMEHSVLCGSRRFPAKDPFVELAKGSMNTFLNAMTYPDKTIYPVASCNDRDLANLMEVYMDAVLHPNIYEREEIFRQEGWHYQLEDPADEIVYNGVVYNEMKGAFSSPDDVVEREIMNSLFPDTVYHHESGGDPQNIPELSYEDFLAFHRTYYHPSNSYIYLYGDMDFEERLAWLDREYLSGYEEKKVDSAITLQSPFDRMARVTRTYPIGSEEDEKDNTFLAWNACIGTSLDTRLASSFAVLNYALLGMPGAPLKQALLDEGIGKDILSSYDSGSYQPIFSVIAKNANASDEGRFLEVIRKTLEEIAAAGVDEKALRAALNIMEFRFREADYGAYPKGLMYGIDAFDSWLYDDDAPFDYLKQLEVYDFLKKQVGTGYYEDLIRRYLLENTHVSLLVAVPERGMTARVEKETAQKLAAYKASLSPEEIDALVRKTKELRAYQETPSTQEELETIPLLDREDLRRESLPFRNAAWQAGKAVLLHHDYATNGIAYIRIVLDAAGVKAEDLPYLSLLQSVLGFVDTENYAYTDLFNEINLNTGGISVAAASAPDTFDAKKTRLALAVHIRTLFDQIDYCFDMAEEILLRSSFEQDKRLREILQKCVSRTRTKLGEGGSATALVRSMSGFSGAQYISDSLGGLRYFDAIRETEEHFGERVEALKEKLRAIMECVLDGEILVSYTGDGSQLERIRERTAALADHIRGRRAGAGTPCGAGKEEEKDPASGKGLLPEARQLDPVRAVSVLQYYPLPALQNVNEGILTPAKVQYVARTGNYREAGFTYTGALRVLRTIMSYDYLWGNIRVVGGAYGCSSSFGRNGDTGWVSYRDPQLKRTMEVYEGVPAFLESFEVSDRDMTKYVIGTISEMDTPLTPSALGARSLNALLGGLTEEWLQKERDEVLAAGRDDIRALSPLTRSVLEQNRLCVLGNEVRLKEEKDMFENLREL